MSDADPCIIWNRKSLQMVCEAAICCVVPSSGTGDLLPLFSRAIELHGGIDKPEPASLGHARQCRVCTERNAGIKYSEGHALYAICIEEEVGHGNKRQLSCGFSSLPIQDNDLCVSIDVKVYNSYKSLPFPIPNIDFLEQCEETNTFLESLIQVGKNVLLPRCETKILENSTMPIHELGQIQTLAGDKYKLVEEKATKEKRSYLWMSPHMVPVCDRNGTAMWVKGKYRDPSRVSNSRLDGNSIQDHCQTARDPNCAVELKHTGVGTVAEKPQTARDPKCGSQIETHRSGNGCRETPNCPRSKLWGSK